MLLSELPSELVNQIYRFCLSISDVIHLSLVCRRLHLLFRSSQKLSILFSAASIEFGPIHDAIQLITFNHAQSAHTQRDPPLTYSLLRQIVDIGRDAQKFEAIYPSVRWKDDFVSRRILSCDERYILRRAVYRYWLYSHAFHNSDYPRSTRLQPQSILARTRLLQTWTTSELFQIEDIRNFIQEIVSMQLCPSNGTVQSDIWITSKYIAPRLRKPCLAAASFRRIPVEGTFHAARPKKPFSDIEFMTGSRWMTEGWGDEITQYYALQDMMKFSPREVLWLTENAVSKWQVEEYIRSLGDWFECNGETFAETFELVLLHRGLQAVEIEEGVEKGIISPTIAYDIS